MEVMEAPLQPSSSPSRVLPEPDADAAIAAGAHQLLVILPIGQHSLVMTAVSVREVVAVAEVTPLPQASTALLGAIAVRGSLLPLYDLTGWCGPEGIGFGPTDSDVDHFGRYATIFHLDDSSFAIESTGHPTIVTSDAAIGHKQPVSISDRVHIGLEPEKLLAELTVPATPEVKR